jgi:hypothetical protein
MMGFVPGRKMLTEYRPLTISMGWTVAVSNIIGVFMMLLLLKILLRSLALPVASIVPLIVTLIFVGSFSHNFQIGDLIVTMGAGALGYFAWRKQHYPIGPFLLGFVLGVLTERNYRITMKVMGASFLLRPISFFLFILFLLAIFYPIFTHFYKRKKEPSVSIEKKEGEAVVPLSEGEAIIVISTMVLFSASILIMTITSVTNLAARTFPLLVSIPTLILGVIQLIREIKAKREGSLVKKGESLREITIFSWFVSFTVLIWLLSFVVAVPIFTYLFTKIYFKSTQRLAITTSAICSVSIYLIFFRLTQMLALGKGLLISF